MRKTKFRFYSEYNKDILERAIQKAIDGGWLSHKKLHKSFRGYFIEVMCFEDLLK
jgi:hypothetical protein